MQSTITTFTKLLLLIFFFYSCERKSEIKNDNIEVINYYEFLNDKGQLRFYFENKTHFKKGLRIDTISVIKNNKSELEKIEIFRCDNDKLYHIDSNYKEHLYFIKKDTCIQLIKDEDKIETCFLGYENLTINGKKLYKSLKFKKQYLSVDGITTHIYFDENFNKIREEFVDGYQFYFRIDKIEERPKSFEQNSVPK